MNNKLEIHFKKLHPDAVVPTYAHNGDVGMDITAISVEYDSENDMYVYHTGLAFESPEGFGAFLFPRSSNRKTDAYLCNHVGIADTATYRGEIMFCFKNRTSIKQVALMGQMEILLSNHLSEINIEKIRKECISRGEYILNNPLDYAPYKPGDRIGQMVVLPHPYIKLIEKEELSDTSRGAGGFGSTGN